MALHLSSTTPASFDHAVMLAAEVVQAGGTIVYPTDTLYGLGGNAWRSDVVERIQRMKKRPDPRSLLAIVHSVETVLGLVTDVSPHALTLMEKFWPGPLTLVLRAGPRAPRPIVAENGTIALRVPSHHFSNRLAEVCNLPVISTSANITGETTASNVDAIELSIGGGVDLFVDGGELTAGKPSTLVDVTSPACRVIRDGAVTRAALLAVIPTIVFPENR